MPTCIVAQYSVTLGQESDGLVLSLLGSKSMQDTGNDNVQALLGHCSRDVYKRQSLYKSIEGPFSSPSQLISVQITF